LQYKINSVNANITSANTAVVTYVNDRISSIIGGAPAALSTLNLIAANLAADTNSIGTIINTISNTNANIILANTAVVSYVNDQYNSITAAWQANAAVQQGLIHTLQTVSLAHDANLGIATNNISNLVANAAIQESEISYMMSDIVTLQSQVYGNANVYTYLPGYTGILGNSSSIRALNSEVSAIQNNIGDLSRVFSETNVGNVAQVLEETISSVKTQGRYINDLQDNANVVPESFTVTGNLTTANLLANGIFWANPQSVTGGYAPLALVALTGRYEDLVDSQTLANVATSGDYNDLLNKPSISINPTGSGARLTGIPNSALINSTISINGTPVSLGGGIVIAADAGGLTGSALNGSVVRSNLTTLGTLTVLNVAGTTTLTGTVNVIGSTTISSRLSAGSTSVTALTVSNPLITVYGSQSSGNPGTQPAGLKISRGDSSDRRLIWSETNGQWQLTNDGSTYGNILTSASTDISYVPGNSNNWAGTPPTTFAQAIDRLAAVIKTLNGGIGA
jgi:hypothetical protein